MNRKTVILQNGTELSYLERPGGERPLVLLHGITDNATTYLPLMGGIDSSRRVYALDFRGHGQSSRPATTYDIAAYSDDVAAFIDTTINAPVDLAGHSLGGLVTIKTAVSRPDLVRSLFIEDPPLYFGTRGDDNYRALFNGILIMATTLQDGSKTTSEWFEFMAAAPDRYSGKPNIETMGEQHINALLDSVRQMDPRALQDALDGALQWDTDTVLRSIRHPVTMIIGNAAIGGVITDEESERVETLVEDCRVVRVPDVGHLIHDYQPEIWLGALDKHLNNR